MSRIRVYRPVFFFFLVSQQMRYNEELLHFQPIIDLTKSSLREIFTSQQSVF